MVLDFGYLLGVLSLEEGASLTLQSLVLQGKQCPAGGGRPLPEQAGQARGGGGRREHV